ncbi:hypothetical protein ACF053_19865 [Streptomyces kanasensis]|uniref:hypothetical protein n=1 Tax=Streptomyces kanasensis TaxID=936756 RepID=UPI0036F8AAC6
MASTAGEADADGPSPPGADGEADAEDPDGEDDPDGEEDGAPEESADGEAVPGADAAGAGDPVGPAAWAVQPAASATATAASSPLPIAVERRYMVAPRVWFVCIQGSSTAGGGCPHRSGVTML